MSALPGDQCGWWYKHAPLCAGGTVYLFDRRAVRFFRKDGHNWRKKADGKTVRETHEKLKVRCAARRWHVPDLAPVQAPHARAARAQVGNMDMLNCYYAHAEQDDGAQVHTNLEPACCGCEEVLVTLLAPSQQQIDSNPKVVGCAALA